MGITTIILLIIFALFFGGILGFFASALVTVSKVNEYKEQCCIAEEKMKEYKELFDIMEKVYNCPAAVLDREASLNKIMFKYIEIRKYLQ